MKEQLIEQTINDFETIDSFMIEAIDQGLDDDQIIEAVEEYFEQLDEQRQMGYIKSWKVSNHMHRGGFAVPAAVSGAAGAAIGHGMGVGAKTGAAIGVGATALAHLGTVRKDARRLRGKSGWVGRDKHMVYNKEFAKDQERKYDDYKKKPFRKRVIGRVKTAVTGNPTHLESFHSDYRTADQEIQENTIRRIRNYLSGKKKTNEQFNESTINSGTGSAVFNSDAHSVTTLNSKGKRTLFMQLNNETDAKKLAARLVKHGGKYHPPGKWK